MSTSPAEAMADQHSTGTEVDLACSSCGECWTVLVPEGYDVTVKQAECPVSGCDGEGSEV
jgi:hypothetical protein